MEHTARDRADRSGGVAVWSARQRPVSVPPDLDDSAPETGRVRLPRSVAWSGQPDYDLGDRRQLCRLYEQVLREGTEADVRRFVRASTLVEVWDELYLPGYVREVWEPWIQAHRGR